MTVTKETEGNVFIDDDMKIQAVKDKITATLVIDDYQKTFSLQCGNLMLEIPANIVKTMVDSILSEKLSNVEITHVTYEPWQLGREQ